MTRGRCSAWIAVAALLVAGLAACSGHRNSAPQPTATEGAAGAILTGPARTATEALAGPSILTGPVHHVTFAKAERAIARLYSRHPGIRSYTYKGVTYTPAARDRVLAVCRQGGPASDAAKAETSRVLGCAPLILFFYSFGTQRSVPESIEVAQKLFWYLAASEGPYGARAQLTDLLQRWGVG